MPQSLIPFPKAAEFYIGSNEVVIENHRIISALGLFALVIHIIHNSDSDRQTLSEFEKHGISFETVIEKCTRELEENAETLAEVIFPIPTKNRTCTIHVKAWDLTIHFSKSVAGRSIAEQFIEKIRNCNGWDELYDEMHSSSQFRKEMKNKIIKEQQ